MNRLQQEPGTFSGPARDPHGGQPVLRAGTAAGEAPLAIVALHGRGAGAHDILGLAAALDRPELAYLAPDAAQWTWYPNRFTAPLEANEPYLSSALRRIDTLLGQLADEGLPAEKVVLLGFSQGACLSLEYAARHPRRYAGVVAFSGGLIGPTLDRDRYPADADFAGTPIFLGCSDRDPHIPLARVQASSRALETMGAQVTERIYPGMPHTVIDDEMEHYRTIVTTAVTMAVTTTVTSALAE